LKACLSFSHAIGIKNNKAKIYLKLAPVKDPKTCAAVRVAMNVPPHINATKMSLM
jgi:hypothetical protein